jgi:predicted transcriptional regulator
LTVRRLTDIRNEDIAGYFGIGYTAVSQAASRLKKEMKKNKELKKIVHEMEEELLSEEWSLTRSCQPRSAGVRNKMVSGPSSNIMIYQGEGWRPLQESNLRHQV